METYLKKDGLTLFKGIHFCDSQLEVVKDMGDSYLVAILGDD